MANLTKREYMENITDIKKEWETPSLERLDIMKTLGGLADAYEGENLGKTERAS